MPSSGKKGVCARCGSKYKTFDFQSDTQLYCEKCEAVTYNVTRPIHAYIGRVAKGLDKRAQTFRMILEYPLELLGQQIVVKLVPYEVHLRTRTKLVYETITVSGGDRVAIGGSMIGGALEGYFSKNLTIGIEEYLMPMVEAKLGIFKKIRVTHPYSAIAKQKVIEAIPRFETEKGKVSAPIDYHAQARNFELLISQLFERLGFKNMSVSGGASDKGIDIEGYMLDESGNLQKIVIQCKHQSLTNLVKPTQIRDFAHTIERTDAYKGYFVTSSLFSPECFFKENCGDKMTLIDRTELQKLLKQHALTLDSVERI